MNLLRSRSAGGIVVSPEGEIAMIQHRIGNGAWLFPKGHVEPGETDEETARREIEEETGLSDLELLDDLGTYERHPWLPDGTKDSTELKTIHMFLFAAPADSILSPTMEIEFARWVPFQRVLIESGNEDDRAWFRRVYDRVVQKSVCLISAR